MICPFVGGGFGCKGNTWPPAILAAMAAKLVGRPVKLEVTRAQMFTSNGYRPQTIQKLRFAADQSGRLVSMRHDGFSQMSMPALGEYSEPVGLPTEMLYACDNVAVTHRLVPTNASLPTYMRAPGEAPGNFALESAMDELAAELRSGSNASSVCATTLKPTRTKTSRSPARPCTRATRWAPRRSTGRAATRCHVRCAMAGT